MKELREKLKERREVETTEQLNALVAELNGEGYAITFGTIGQKTTYALLSKDDEEIVGYTFIKDLKYKNPLIGKLKSLQQAVARKSLLSQREEENN